MKKILFSIVALFLSVSIVNAAAITRDLVVKDVCPGTIELTYTMVAGDTASGTNNGTVLFNPVDISKHFGAMRGVFIISAYTEVYADSTTDLQVRFGFTEGSTFYSIDSLGSAATGMSRVRTPIPFAVKIGSAAAGIDTLFGNWSLLQVPSPVTSIQVVNYNVASGDIAAGTFVEHIYITYIRPNMVDEFLNYTRGW